MIFSAFLSRPVLRFRRSLIMISGRPFRGFPFTVLLLLLLMLLFQILLQRIFLWVLIVLRFLPILKLLRRERPLLLVPPRALLPSTLGVPWLNRLVVLLVLVCLWKSDNESDDAGDACVEILLVTCIRSPAVIPSPRNNGGSFAAPIVEGPSTRDSRGKGIMVDCTRFKTHLWEVL
nr:hypothetical protein [Tanacetum cinerariifolium]